MINATFQDLETGNKLTIGVELLESERHFAVFYAGTDKCASSDWFPRLKTAIDDFFIFETARLQRETGKDWSIHSFLCE